MPRLPGQAQVPAVRLARAPGVRATPDAFGAQQARAVEGFGAAIATLGEKLQQREAQIEAAEDDINLETFRGKVVARADQMLQEPERQTIDDPESFAPTFKRDLEGFLADEVKALPQRQQLRARQLSQQVVNLYDLRARNRGATLKVGKMQADVDASLSERAIAVFRDPTQFVTHRDGGEQAIREAGKLGAIDATQIEENVAAWNRQVAESFLSALPPAARLAQLDEGLLDADLGDPLLIARLTQQAREEVLAGTRDRVRDAIEVLDKGRVPVGLEATQAAARGTELAEPLAVAVQHQEAVAEFITAPLPEQAARIKAMAAQGRVTREQLERQERFQRAFTTAQTAINQGHGLQVAVEAGAVAPLQDLDFNDPASLSRRAVKAQAASVHVGRPISPFTPQEAANAIKFLDTATPGQVTTVLNTLNRGLGQEQAGYLAAQLAPDRPELAAALSLSVHLPTIARDVVQGGRLVRENRDVVPEKAQRVAAIENVYGNLFTAETAGALPSFMAAGTALYAARRIPGGDLSYDEDEFEQALRDVAGGPVEINGRMILPPIPGMDADAVDDLVDGLTDDDLARLGNGKPVFADGSAFTVGMFSRFLGTDAQLVTSGLGRYLILMPGMGYAMSDQGSAYEVDLRAKVGG